jgi:ABC-2 type transport system permease protein
MKKYWLFFKSAAEYQLRNPAMMVMRLCFLAALVFTTEQLWRVIGHKGFDPVNIVWYLTMGEVLMFSYDNRLQTRIFNDIRSGNIGYSLIRPFSYLKQIVAEGMGVFCISMIFITIGGMALAFCITGGFPATIHGIGAIVVLMILSGFFITLCLVSIGLLGLYMQSSKSVFMIWQKLMFVLGGLLFPLTIYPQWMQTLAAYTPFPWAMYEISRLIYEFNWQIALNTAVHLAGWTALVALLAGWLFKSLLKKVSVNGG